MTGRLPQPGAACDAHQLRLADIRLVIFDFDGVVADSEILSLSTLRQALDAYGIQQSPTDVRKTFLGTSLKTINAYVAKHSPERSADGFTAKWQDALFAAFMTSLKPVPSLPPLLAHLRRSGMPYCIASSSSFERLGVALAAMGLTDQFPHVFSADEVTRGKPAPDLFLLAAKAMGVPPGGCLVIEDSPYGIRASVEAGMQTVGFVGGEHLAGIEGEHEVLLQQNGADLVVKSLKKLIDLGLATPVSND